MIYIIKSFSGVLSLESLEGVDLQVLDETVKLLLSIFVLVLLPADSHPNFPGNVSDSVAPEEPVQGGVHPHVLVNNDKMQSVPGCTFP